MRGTLGFALLLIAAFVIIFMTTRDIWAATNGAGIIAVIFLVVTAFRLIRVFNTRWQKMTVATVSVVLILGLVTHWIITWRTTEWSYDQLQSIRRFIYNETAMYTLRTPALETFREFRRSPPGTTIGEVFRRLNPGGVPVVDSLLVAEMGSFTASVSDAAVQLTQEARFVPGFDSAFVNDSGKHGFAQIQIRVTPGGASYDIQN